MRQSLDIQRISGTTNKYGAIVSCDPANKLVKITWECDGCEVEQRGRLGLSVTLFNGRNKNRGYKLRAKAQFENGEKLYNSVEIWRKDIPKPSLISRLLTNWI